MFTFHCVASPSTLVKFSSASSEYLKLVDSSTHDYNYWRNHCTGKLFNQQKKVNHWVGGIPDRKPSEIDGNTSVQKGIGGSRGRYQGCPPWVQILSFSCSFWEIAPLPPRENLRSTTERYGAIIGYNLPKDADVGIFAIFGPLYAPNHYLTIFIL